MNISSRYRQLILTAGFTLILVAYFLVWLPQPAAGLSFIGIDLGEWIKFIPQVQSGELGINRNIFYLPPITLGLMLITWSASWLENRWQTWVLRLFAIVIAVLSLPSIEAFTEEATSEWLARTVMVLVVILFAILMPLKRYLPPSVTLKAKWLVIGLLGLAGAVLPSWTYLVLREPVSQLLQANVEIGFGVWLNALGHIIATVIAIHCLISRDCRSLASSLINQEA